MLVVVVITAHKPRPHIHMIRAAKLDPYRASRKFTESKPSEDPNVELKEKQAARAGRMTNMQAAVDEVELEKKKAQRQEAARQLEEK